MKKRILFLSLFFVGMTFAESTETAPGVYVFKHADAKTTWTQELPKDAIKITETCYADRAQKTVYVLSEMCGLGKGYECEFVLLGSQSDRAYESLAIAWDSPSTINSAVETLGVTKGTPANPDRGLGMAKGERFTVTLKRLAKEEPFRPLNDFLVDTFSTPTNTLFDRGFPYVGEANFDDLMPSAILALYTEKCSTFGLPYYAPKTVAYGCFRTTTEETYGEPVIVALTWNQLPGQARVYNHQVTLTAETIANPDVFIAELKKLCEDPRDVFLRVQMAPTLQLTEVAPFAKLLLSLEAEGGFTLDAPEHGQLPLRAFTPDEKWRDREARVFQPWEVEIKPGKESAQVTLCQILEDWNVEGMNPALTRKCYPGVTPKTIGEVMKRIDANDGKIYVVFFYVAPGVTVGDLVPYAEAITIHAPTQWIFFESIPNS